MVEWYKPAANLDEAAALHRFHQRVMTESAVSSDGEEYRRQAVIPAGYPQRGQFANRHAWRAAVARWRRGDA
ncbi:MAG: hypothetical protein FP826_01570 [Sphingomonadales bacterium]|nr:hypothetical protein [Sphingomonadales bacterium]MBU3993752.1 hypothetical protein [Alphaproteobacteria bacterium]